MAGTYEISDNKAYVRKNGLKGFSLFKFWARIYLSFLLAHWRLVRTLLLKKCYYGPFKGEFGHMLAHTAPFLMFLHKRGVKIIYCGMQIHAPILVNDDGDSIIYDYRPLRDFFAEVPPNSNSAIPPADVQAEIKKFEDEAIASKWPFWNIGDDYYYFFIHRNFLNRRICSLYNLKKVYGTENRLKAIALFPRRKGGKWTPNNGGPWEYDRIIEIVKPFVDKVYVVGHPSQSLDIPAQDKVEICITADNRIVLEKCANSALIISQHSGVGYLADYFSSQILYIFNGEGPIQGMGDTLRFRKILNPKLRLEIARSYEEIGKFVGDFFS